MAIRWMMYRGKKVLQCDYRGLGPDLSLIQLEEAGRVIMRCHDRVLFLSSFEGAQINPGFVKRVHELGKALARERTMKVAIVGVLHMAYVMREAYSKLAGEYPSFFNSEREALDWLVNQAKN